MIKQKEREAASHKWKEKEDLESRLSKKERRFLILMKTVEQKKNERLPKYITTKELTDLLNSKEMRRLVRKLEELEYYKKITKNVLIGE